MPSSRGRRLVPAVIFAASFVALTVQAASFPPVTDAERALTEVPGYPGAPAVVLFEKADLALQHVPRDQSSVMKVHVRLKILTEEGKDHGEISIFHSRFRRLSDLDGRTVLADGTEVPLPKDSVFEERSSRARKSFVTRAAFPAVEAGAIVEYRYTMRWDNLYFMEPWYFSNLEIPTLLSEITYHKPDNMAATPYVRVPSFPPLGTDVSKDPKGTVLRVWMENPPAIADEPFSPPFEDLAGHYMLAPKEIDVSGQRLPIFDSWETVCDTFSKELYKDFRKKDGKAKALAQQLAGASPRETAAALYAFVRDEIRTEHGFGVFTRSDSSVDRLLEERWGRAAEKALLLLAMLDAVKIGPAQPVWALDSADGQPDLSLANPWWFDRVLVRLELDGELLYLDPSDRRVGFGRIGPGLEGTQAIVHDRKRPQQVVLPERPFDENLRRAEIALVLDDEGRLTGTGSLYLAGHHARSYLRWKDDAEATAEAWKDWVEAAFPGYDAADVAVDEKIEEQLVRVSFALAQREEEVLGDEASLDPSRPLGPVRQPFTLPAQRRQTPVLLSFADRDEVALTLTWTEGWELDLVPTGLAFQGAVGAVGSAVEVDEAERRLTFTRRVDVTSHDLRGRAAYTAIQSLYRRIEKNDAQSLVLVRE